MVFGAATSREAAKAAVVKGSSRLRLRAMLATLFSTNTSTSWSAKLRVWEKSVPRVV
jgi:hypothetical protein